MEVAIGTVMVSVSVEMVKDAVGGGCSWPVEMNVVVVSRLVLVTRSGALASSRWMKVLGRLYIRIDFEGRPTMWFCMCVSSEV